MAESERIDNDITLSAVERTCQSDNLVSLSSHTLLYLRSCILALFELLAMFHAYRRYAHRTFTKIMEDPIVSIP